MIAKHLDFIITELGLLRNYHRITISWRISLDLKLLLEDFWESKKRRSLHIKTQIILVHIIMGQALIKQLERNCLRIAIEVKRINHKLNSNKESIRLLKFNKKTAIILLQEIKQAII